MYRVFVVEDDPVIAGAICAQMDSWGLEARCAKDFGAVMAEFAAFDPQLVLLDISLPRYSGYHWLMLRLWQTDSFVDENTLTVNVTRLRRKLEALGLGDFIKTRKGLGYIID